MPRRRGGLEEATPTDCGRRGVAASQDASHAHPVDPERVRRARQRVPSREDAERLSGVLGLLADPTRSRVLHALDGVEELCVGDLALALDAGEDAVGYALRVLRTAGMVQRRREGRVAYYRLAEGFPEPLRVHCLRALLVLSSTTPDGDGNGAGNGDGDGA